jgi:hypothetical protein
MAGFATGSPKDIPSACEEKATKFIPWFVASTYIDSIVKNIRTTDNGSVSPPVSRLSASIEPGA